MSDLPSPEEFTDEQIKLIEQAELLVINARNEGIAMLVRAGIPLPEPAAAEEGEGWCNAYIEGFGRCPCRHYKGDGEPCTNKTTLDQAFPAVHPCHHKKEDHSI